MIDRYAKQELFLGTESQEKLQNAAVLIVGAGALGSSIAEMLARAGVGTLTIIDRDYVEWSNLQRQQLYTEDDAIKKLPKAVAAKHRLQEINSSITINSYITDLNSFNIENFVVDQSIIVDATDNFETRMIVNDAAVKHRIPFIFGACVGSYGITLPIHPGETPCLHCLLDQIPILNMTCDTVGVISPIVQIVAALQVTAVLKFIAGKELKPVLQSIDIWKNENAEINIGKLKSKSCPTCGEHQLYPFLKKDIEMKTDILCGRNAIQLRNVSTFPFSLDEIANRLKESVKDLIVNPYLLSCSLDENRIVLFKDGRAIIHGTNQPDVAKAIYHQLITV